MTIGINATAAIRQPRTGVEEYCYQIIKHLTMLPESEKHRFFLYVLKGDPNNPKKYFDFELPDNFEVKQLNWPLPMWTQIRLASELVFNKPDVLFIPVHILPLVHPKNSVVTIHGLEYEYFPEYYPFWFRNYLRWSTRYAVKNARKIIAVSENTKQDLIKLYGADEPRIQVVHHGVSFCHSDERQNPDRMPDQVRHDTNKTPYLLYIGRLELKKNILGILEAYRTLKEKYKIPHQLLLAGSPGFGYEIIKVKIKNLLEIGNWKLEIKELGYVSEDEKQHLLNNSAVFLFPSFYEGFGLPILEAQAVGVPVVASNNSSVPEVAGDSALLVNPKTPEQIAEAVYKIIDDKATRDKLVESGYENIKRFSWEQCARETLDILCA